VNPAVFAGAGLGAPQDARPCSTNGIACAWMRRSSDVSLLSNPFSTRAAWSVSKTGKRILSFALRSGERNFMGEVDRGQGG